MDCSGNRTAQLTTSKTLFLRSALQLALQASQTAAPEYQKPELGTRKETATSYMPMLFGGCTAGSHHPANAIPIFKGRLDYHSFV